MATSLVGDIGGTNIRLAMIRNGVITAKKKYVTNEHPTLLTAIRDFLETTQQKPEKCCLAIAGAVSGGKVQISNLKTQQIYDEVEFSQILNFSVTFINDFAANGYYFRGFDVASTDEIVIQSGSLARDKVMYVGAGTGLGHGSTRGGRISPSEAGHTSFVCNDAFDDGFREFVKLKLGVRRMCTERAVSGPGIENIAEYMMQRDAKAAEGHYTPGMAAKDIYEKALEAKGKSPEELQHEFCYQVIKRFYHYYGNAIGDLAIVELPTHIFIAGGIIVQHLEFFNLPDIKNTFFDAFLNKGRLAEMLEQIQIAIITNEDIALFGCQNCIVNGK